jgi:hypothetical protein
LTIIATSGDAIRRMFRFPGYIEGIPADEVAGNFFADS